MASNVQFFSMSVSIVFVIYHCKEKHQLLLRAKCMIFNKQAGFWSWHWQWRDIYDQNVCSSGRHIDSSGHMIVGKTTTNLMVVPSGKGTHNKSPRIQLSSLGQWYTNPYRTCSDSLISVKRSCGLHFTSGGFIAPTVIETSVWRWAICSETDQIWAAMTFLANGDKKNDDTVDISTKDAS